MCIFVRLDFCRFLKRVGLKADVRYNTWIALTANMSVELQETGVEVQVNRAEHWVS
jgi:hypothetical protein